MVTSTRLEPIKEDLDSKVMGGDIPKQEWNTFSRGFDKELLSHFRRTKQTKPGETSEIKFPQGKSKTEHIKDYRYDIFYAGTYAMNVFSAYILYRKNLFDYSRFEDGWTQQDEKKLFWKEQFSFPTIPKIINYIKSFGKK